MIRSASTARLAVLVAAVFMTGCASLPLTGVSPRASQGSFGARSASDYDGAQGKTGQVLLAALKQAVSAHKDLGYDGARDAMFKDVDDLDNDNVVECVYTGRTVANVTNRGTAYQNGKGLNAEHTWPQSKGAEGAAKADLHHLFSTDCVANSTRGSFPFGTVASQDWAEGGSRRGTDAQGRIVFEPRPEHRGNVARALLYFYTVYGQRASLDNFRVEEETLKRWHVEDPVDAAEKARNELVFKIQGNRNPYVDRPEFVQAVGEFLDTGRYLPIGIQL